MAAEVEWLRVRGIGRERFAGHLSEFLTSVGFTVEKTESTEPSESHVVARLTRPNPAVPNAAKEMRFRLFPTSGGAAIAWIAPVSAPEGERSRLDRLVRELVAHLERSILTESHATAKVTKVPDVRLPWEIQI
ncbi:MAG: hypothetical protein L3J93_01005 [Thermoplasmata archaeon]|nr:hypothetical protein [Thermoplasmata archaeon]